jgi:hypothetical protein
VGIAAIHSKDIQANRTGLIVLLPLLKALGHTTAANFFRPRSTRTTARHIATLVDTLLPATGSSFAPISAMATYIWALSHPNGGSHDVH